MAYYDNVGKPNVTTTTYTRQGSVSHTMGTSTSSTGGSGIPPDIRRYSAFQPAASPAVSGTPMTAPMVTAFQPTFQPPPIGLGNFQIGGGQRSFFRAAATPVQHPQTVTVQQVQPGNGTVNRSAPRVVSRHHVGASTTIVHRSTYPGDMHGSDSTLTSTMGNNPTSGHSSYGANAVMSISASDNKQESFQQGLRRFNAFYPESVVSPKVDVESKERQAVGHLRRGENKPSTIPGGAHVAIGSLNGKLVLRGPAECLDKLKQHSTLMELEAKGAIYWIEEGPVPSGQIVAFDFDKTLVKNFLWQELGGLQGSNAQVRTLQNQWLRNRKLEEIAFGGRERIDRIRRVIEICQKRGDIVCILSSGFCQVIREVLKYVSLNDMIPDDLVYGSDGPPFGASKSARLKNIGKMHGRPHTALVDDDKNYIAQAHREGHQVIWVKEGAGLTEREFRLLETGEWDEPSVWTRAKSR